METAAILYREDLPSSAQEECDESETVVGYDELVEGNVDPEVYRGKVVRVKNGETPL